MNTDTRTTNLHLRTAIDLLDAGKRPGWIVANLGDDAYQLASHYSEQLNGVGLTGLVEDIANGNADRDDLRCALERAGEVTARQLRGGR
jgi:hypothetical protein